MQPSADERTTGANILELSLANLGDAPLVVAFASRWSAEGESAEDVATIRAELRGLGTVLIVLSDTGIWSFRPDDDLERLAPRDAALDAIITRLASRYGVRRAKDGTLPLAVFLVDAEGTVRFATGARGDGSPVERSLAEALSAAGQSVTARSRSPLVSRREVVMTSLVAGLVLFFGDGCSRRPPVPSPTDGRSPPPAYADAATGDREIVLHVNGVERALRIDPRVSLLDALRERLGLMGTKKGCDHGQCGACTVLLEGRRVCSCLVLAVMAEGAKVTTIEGLADGDRLHPVQQAFVTLDAFQCGYCTPGQIMSAVGLLSEGHARSDDDVREQMSGNLCRCGAYPNIVAAVQLARKGT